MGNTCTFPDSKNITIPSKVIQVQTNHTHHKLPHMASAIKLDHSIILTKAKSYTSEPQTSPVDNDEEQKTNYTLRPITLKYDLHELGIGEYYLEKELAESKKQEIARKQKKIQEKASIKWDRAVVQMRVRFPQNSQDEPFYSQVDNCLKEYAACKPKSFEKMMKRGPPMRYRWSVWKNILEPDRFYVSELYEKLKSLSSPWENDIRKDLHRTFPDEPYFSSEKFNCIGQEQLFNILKAISLYLPNVGYTQSMNFLAGFLLLISGGNELEAFWTFITLARDHRFLMMGFFEKDFPLLKFYIFVFYEVLETEMPALHEHLKQQQVPDELWLLKWFFTVFLYNFPPKYVIRIWDFIIMEGLLGIIKVSLGIIKVLEKDMLLLDAFGMDLLFKYLKDEGNRMTNISHVNNHTSPQNNNNNNMTGQQEQQEGVDHVDFQNPVHATSVMFVQEMNKSYINVDQSNADNHTIPRVVVGPSVNASHINQTQTQREQQGVMFSIHNETSDVQYNTKQLDIDEVLEYAERTTMTIEKLLYYADLYTEKTRIGLPEPYNRFFKDFHLYQTDVNKIIEFQNEIDFHLMKSELSDKPNEEIIVSNLLAEEEDTLILKDLAL